MSLESAYSAIERLVKDFQSNERYYLSNVYSEAEARRDFIDKFFEALGWDIYHNVQKNPYEQEVKVEKTVANESWSKKADYSFSIAPRFGEPVFYVEAKKPFKNLSNPDYYFQAIRYGWSSNTPLVILTDFEEFHIIDSRYEPKIKTALERTLQSYHYTDYLDKEKFKRIYYLFSRDSIVNNAIGDYVNTLKVIKGKKISSETTGKYQSIDDSFLDELDKIRNDLAKAFKKNNRELSSDELTEAVQRTIDRLVFMRFLEAKLIEPENQIKQYFRKGIAWNNFIKDCKRLDAKYNGVVFKNHPLIDSERFIPIENKSFEKICDRLIHEKSPYDFNLIPIHILGSIYERFLGKVVHATEKQVRIEEKPEVRKAGGVYYTPQYIVKYIVDNTVGKIIDGLTPAQISKLKFADIACGSGSFLITVFDTLLKYHSKWYNNNPEQAKKDICLNINDSWFLILEHKRNILQNNIYGVDLDPQAVEVTQVSLFLKLLEDESPSSIHLTDMFLKEAILPDLSKNIKCGNSLVGTEILNNNLFGNDIDEEKIKPMDFETAFPDIMNNGGFDVIVGNPPYIKIQNLTETSPETVKYINDNFYSAEKGSYDIYIIFLERASKLINKKGYIGYIVPHKFFNSNYGKNIRDYLLKDRLLSQIIFFGEYQIFKSATTYTCLLFMDKNNKDSVEVCELDETTIELLKANNIIFQKIKYNNWLNTEWNIISESNQNILNKFLHFKKLIDISTNIFQGSKAGADDVFILKCIKQNENTFTCYSKSLNKEFEIEKGIVRKYIKGKFIKRYYINYEPNEYALYPYDNEGKLFSKNYLVNKFPKAYQYLESNENKKILLKREEGRFSEIWWSYSRPQNMKVIFQEKIITPFNAFSNSFSYDNNCDFIFSAGVSGAYGIILNNEFKISYKYLIGILNSKLTEYIIHQTSTYLRGGFYSYENKYIKNLPIKTIDFNNGQDKSKHDSMVSLVNQMLESKKKQHEVTTESQKTYYEDKCNALDKQIDELVYELYEITDEEKQIIEGK